MTTRTASLAAALLLLFANALAGVSLAVEKEVKGVKSGSDFGKECTKNGASNVHVSEDKKNRSYSSPDSGHGARRPAQKQP
jgi:hypothetical protein